MESCDLLYGVAAIAAFLGIPKRAVQHQIDVGRIPSFKLGKSICVRRRTLENWIEEMEASHGKRI